MDYESSGFFWADVARLAIHLSVSPIDAWRVDMTDCLSCLLAVEQRRNAALKQQPLTELRRKLLESALARFQFLAGLYTDSAGRNLNDGDLDLASGQAAVADRYQRKANRCLDLLDEVA